MNKQENVCPVCNFPYQSQDTACNNCGLIFPLYEGVSVGTTIKQTPSSSSLSNICPHCGKQTTPNAKVCGQCGNRLFYEYTQLKPGQLLAKGDYTVERALSKGGMGAIYLATDNKTFNRTVVIKAMLDYFDPSNPQEVKAARERFLQEAKTLSKLRHSSIPQIYTYFQDGIHNYIVMEYIEGDVLERSLTRYNNETHQTISGSSYPQKKVIQWGIVLCRVLEYLSGLRPEPVVHHDIKPANVLFDHNSNEIRLVDFGTAKARLLVQEGGSVGLQKSSVFGTHGYAPPEQYQGMSEPRSDVYALAATLYHLATDDDPSGHPFDFPQLNKLGQFGKILEKALQLDVCQRPTATEFRKQLESLIGLGPPIEAPDRTKVHNEQELVAWCEQYWKSAVGWLYKNLPDLIENVWGKSTLAQSIRTKAQQLSANRNAALDAVLEILDPSGFGQEQPNLKTNKSTLNFGFLPVHGKKNLSLQLFNEGRRNVSFSLNQPKWVRGGRSQLNLIPRQSSTIIFTADMSRVKMGGTLNDKITAQSGLDILLTVKTKATVSSWKTLWAKFILFWSNLWEPVWGIEWYTWAFTIVGGILGFINGLQIPFFIVPIISFIFLVFGLKNKDDKTTFLSLISLGSFFVVASLPLVDELDVGGWCIIPLLALVGAIVGFTKSSSIFIKKNSNNTVGGAIGGAVGSIVMLIFMLILAVILGLVYIVLNFFVSNEDFLGKLLLNIGVGIASGFIVDIYGWIEKKLEEEGVEF